MFRQAEENVTYNFSTTCNQKGIILTNTGDKWNGAQVILIHS